MRLNEVVGREVRALRKQRGYTQSDVAFYAGLATSTVSSIERGQHNVSLALLEWLAVAFQVSPYRLFGIDPDEHTRRVAAEDALAKIAAYATLPPLDND